MTQDGVIVRTALDAGERGLVRQLVEVLPRARFTGMAGAGGELCFVLEGLADLVPEAGPATALPRDTAFWVPPGARYELSATGPGPLRLDRVTLPPGGPEPAGATPGTIAVSRLHECPVEVTGDRRFRVLFGPSNGCGAATQFAGEIPPGRAPAHTHTYDEVVLVLAGEGILHAGREDRPIGPGTCVHLPPGTPHCLENTGRTTLRVLGVFHPGGSPAAKTTAGPATGTA